MKKIAIVTALIAALGISGFAFAHGAATEKTSDTTVTLAQKSWWPYD